jgi:hypothetical protein
VPRERFLKSLRIKRVLAKTTLEAMEELVLVTNSGSKPMTVFVKEAVGEVEDRIRRQVGRALRDPRPNLTLEYVSCF